MSFDRGDVILVNFSPVVGSEQGNIRPAIVVSDEIFQRLGLIIVVAITSRIIQSFGRVPLKPDSANGLDKASDVLAYQVRTISTDQKRIVKKLGRLSQRDLARIDEALKIVLKLA
ncbi:MAG: type II toxin-antitoxin system PemK/MazF family toxin [bacterium]|nr:type II toxin-antitoxin system PemK/MazF family toxin [bacterium]